MKIQDASTQRGIATRAWAKARIEMLHGVVQRRLISSPGDVATRPGNGVTNWQLVGRVLKHRQLEIDYEPVDDRECLAAIAIERRISRELYP